MAQRLTTFSKFLITLLIVAGIFFLGRFILNQTGMGESLKQQAEEQTSASSTDNSKNTNTSPSSSSSNSSKANTNSSKGGTDDDVLKVQIFTWGGYAPGLYFNEGDKWSKNSRFYKEYGIKVDFKLIDDFDASRQAWKADEVHLLGNEISAMNTEMEGLAPYDPKILLQCDWSRGGDAVVVRGDINSVNDLKGKKVAYAGYTPSVTLLVHMLESAGLEMSDIDPQMVASSVDAANAFKSGSVAAAVIWSSEINPCLREVKRSKVLQSTKEASNLIADVFMVKEEYARANKDKLAKFYEGWMKAAAEINTEPANKAKAVKILSEVVGLPKEDAGAMIDDVQLTTHGDNLNFFGQNTGFKGMTAEKLYTKMGIEFEKIKQAPSKRPTWRSLSYNVAMNAANLPGAEQKGEEEKVFKAPTAKEKTVQEFASKPVSITFPTGSSSLGDNAKTIIDLQFADIAKAYATTRIRVEGNTDNVGNAASNQKLSEKRAEAVAKYLINEYDMNPNRLVIVGNGPRKPVKGCEGNQNDSCKQKNRRTEFQLIPG